MLKLKVLTLDECFFEGEILRVDAETTSGSTSFLEDHVNSISTIDEGEITIKVNEKDKELKFIAFSGIIQIKNGTEASVLVQQCFKTEDIDLAHELSVEEQLRYEMTKTTNTGEMSNLEMELKRVIKKISVKG